MLIGLTQLKDTLAELQVYGIQTLSDGLELAESFYPLLTDEKHGDLILFKLDKMFHILGRAVSQ